MKTLKRISYKGLDKKAELQGFQGYFMDIEAHEDNITSGRHYLKGNDYVEIYAKKINDFYIVEVHTEYGKENDDFVKVVLDHFSQFENVLLMLNGEEQ